MLTSGARDTLRNVEAVILDEIHALAPTKRGAHLMLSLERLDELCERAPQRIGLSATQRPARRDRPLPRRLRRARPAPPGHHRRRRHPQAARARGRRPRRGHGRSRPRARRAGQRPCGRRAGPQEHLALRLPPHPPGGAGAPQHHHLLQRPPAGRAHGGPPERAGRRRGHRRGRHGRSGQGPPRLAGARAARRHRGPAEAGRAARPRRHLQPRARHRHGRRRPRHPGGVTGCGQPRPAAHRPGRPLGGRAQPRQALPQAPGRPAGGGRRHAADARRPHRGDPLPPQPARRAGPADRGHRLDGGVSPSTTSPPWCGAAPATPTSPTTCSTPCSTCWPVATPARSSASCGPASCGTASPAGCGPGTAPSGWPSRAAAPSPTAGCSACSCPTAPGSASSTRRWCTRAARARPSSSARRTWRIEDITFERVVVTPAPGQPGKMPFWHGDRPGRPLELGRALGAFVREVRSLAPEAAQARLMTDHSARRAGPPATSSATSTSRPRPPASCPTTAPSWSSASATRSATGGSACSRPFGTPVHAPWAMAIEQRLHGPLRHGRRDHVERRRHRDPPARVGRRAAGGRDPRRPRRDRGAGARRAARHVAVLVPLPGVRGPGAAAAPSPARLPHAAVAAAPAGRRPARRWRPSTPRSRSCWRPAGSACRTCSTCPPCATVLADLRSRQDPARHRRHAEGVAVRPEPAVQLDRRLHVRGRRPAGRAPRRGAGPRPGPAPRAARRRGAARADRRRACWPTSSSTCSASATTGGPARPTRSTTSCVAWAT